MANPKRIHSKHVKSKCYISQDVSDIRHTQGSYEDSLYQFVTTKSGTYNLRIRGQHWTMCLTTRAMMSYPVGRCIRYTLFQFVEYNLRTNALIVMCSVFRKEMYSERITPSLQAFPMHQPVLTAPHTTFCVVANFNLNLIHL